MVYVDNLFECPAFGFRYWCHLTADSLSELHAFATKIGLKKSWFQDRPKASYPHYDLTKSKRTLAIKNGASQLNSKDFILKCHALTGT